MLITNLLQISINSSTLYADIDLSQVAEFRNEHPFQKDRFIR
jgi:predicted amidohydrolase